MALSSRPYTNRYVPSNRFPDGTKWLLIATSAVSILYMILARANSAGFMDTLFLNPSTIIRSFTIWQLVTHVFLNSSVMQLLWNMLSLWMFGAELERTWGTQRFLRFYFACALVAAVCATIVAALFGGPGILPLGASEAILGLLVGYAVMFPDNTLLFGFLIPMKSKYFVMIIAAVVILQSMFYGAVLTAHLSAMLTGLLILRGKRFYTQSNRLASDNYKEWKLRRAKRKFEVYLRKNDSKRDRTLH